MSPTRLSRWAAVTNRAERPRPPGAYRAGLVFNGYDDPAWARRVGSLRDLGNRARLPRRDRHARHGRGLRECCIHERDLPARRRDLAILAWVLTAAVLLSGKGPLRTHPLALALAVIAITRLWAFATIQTPIVSDFAVYQGMAVSFIQG
jgi:hypothetical protein